MRSSEGKRAGDSRAKGVGIMSLQKQTHGGFSHSACNALDKSVDCGHSARHQIVGQWSAASSLRSGQSMKNGD